jgi:hypothetical protein
LFLLTEIRFISSRVDISLLIEASSDEAAAEEKDFMAAELMLINPRRKRRAGGRRKAVTRMRRNPRRRRKMSALQMKYFGKGHKKHSRRRRRSASIVAMTRNPIRRKRHHRRSRKAFTIMRRNPFNFTKGSFIEDVLVPSSFGALGGVATNWIFSNYAPAQFRTGLLLPISQLGLAALLGMGVGAMSDEKTGAMVSAGAATVIIYQWLEDYLQNGLLYPGQNITGNPLGRFVPTTQRMGRFMRMGRIVSSNMSGVGRIKGMGYVGPARNLAC